MKATGNSGRCSSASVEVSTGVHFAYLEMKVVLARLLTSLQLGLIDEPKPVPGAKTKWPASPCRVRYQVISGGESPFQAG
jgi:hypothetical protein